MLNNKFTRRNKNNKYNKNNQYNNKKKRNSQIESLKVSYPETILQSINNNQNLTKLPNIYNNSPIISILNSKPKLYLTTMTDPDAPNGMANTTNTTNITNHTYTHWVYLQDMRNTNQNKNQTKNRVLVKYAPPSPPYGIHRYQFQLYDITNLSPTILATLKNNSNNNNIDRNTYYENKLKQLNEYKINKSFQYKVNSGKT